MREIGAHEAKTHLPKLLDQVEKGERFIITRYGRAVAELAPVGQRSASDVRRAIKDLRSLREELERRGVRMTDLLREAESVRDIAHQTHRY